LTGQSNFFSFENFFPEVYTNLFPLMVSSGVQLFESTSFSLYLVKAASKQTQTTAAKTDAIKEKGLNIVNLNSSTKVFAL
jgi:hypothetical protein